MAKKRNKKQNNRSNNNYLKDLLLMRNYTLKDLKAEVILMTCQMLIKNFLLAEEKGTSNLVLEELSSKKSNIIYTTMKSLNDDLVDNIITDSQMQDIISNSNKNATALKSVKTVEPISFFYNITVLKLKSKILELTRDETKILWIPELIAIFSIQDMKENNYTFKKFPFLDKYDFDSLLEIYIKTNQNLKKLESVDISKKKHKLQFTQKSGLQIQQLFQRCKWFLVQ